MTKREETSIFVEQYGQQLPAVYTDFRSEYSAATTAAGIYDSSYIGRLKAIGEDGLDLLNRMSTNKVIDLGIGEGAVTVLTTDRGRIVDVLSVVNQGDFVLLLTSPGQQQPVIDWLDKYTILEDLAIENITTETSMLSIVGPDASELVGLSPHQISQDSLTVQSITMNGIDTLAVAQSLGSLSRYWLIVRPDDFVGLWQHLEERGASPIGANAVNAIRINYGIPEYGPELGEPYNPLEAGLIGSVDFTKGCYIGQEVIARLDSYKKVKRHLVTLTFDNGAAVSSGDELEQDGQPVGRVTSIAPESSDGVLKGLGYVKANNASPGSKLTITGNHKVSADILSLAQPYGPAKD